MSITSRAALAVLLMISFYLLAFGMAAALLGLVYVQFMSGHILLKLSLALIILAILIIWSVLPRWDSFHPPGPELTRSEYPKLFEGIESLARKCGHPVPKHVYLLHDANAWVAQRGGIMGFFSKPVMAIGLPIFKILTTEQLLAVVAHEFGHFVGGDTKLGPWTYKTRQAIGRTIAAVNSWLQHVFIWYGNLFLRITQAISRQQEFSADALAARIMGKQAIATALEKISFDGVKYDAYFQAEVVPLLERGFIPDIDGGYAQAIRNSQFLSNVEKNFVSGEKSPYDSHPPLTERLAAIAALAEEAPTDTHTEPALALLPENKDEIEKNLFEFLLKTKLKTLAWDEIIESAYKPMWAETVEMNENWLGKADAQAVYAMAKNMEDTVKRIDPKARLNELAPEQIYFVLQVLGSALALRLIELGYSAKIEIGSEWEFVKAEKKFNPFRLVHEAANETAPAPEF